MFNDLYRHYLTHLEGTKKCRQLQDPSLLNRDMKDRKKIIDFSTNDYLLLSRDPDLLKAAIDCGKKYGVGATGSRLLSGNSFIFSLLESEIALKKKTQAALFFSSGYLANSCALAALLDKIILNAQALVFFDKLNHASLYHAVFLSGAALVRYKHNDIQALAHLLEKYKNDSRPKFIVTETVFGMDGDQIPLQDIIFLAEKYDCFLYLDEAHATGIFGAEGYGLSTLAQFPNLNYAILGTFSKALGVSGAYVACSDLLAQYLINKAGGFIYSTAASPMVAGAALAAWRKVKGLGDQRQNLLKLAEYSRSALQENGFCCGLSQTHILPIIVKEEQKALQLQKILEKKGIKVSAIRPPTVPPQSSRLRLALNIGHEKDDIDSLITVLKNR